MPGGPPRTDRFAHEARLHHLSDRDLDDHRSTLRQDFHQAHPCEADQRFADRLAGDTMALGDVLLRQPRPGEDFERDDGSAQLALNTLRRGSVRNGKMRVHSAFLSF